MDPTKMKILLKATHRGVWVFNDWAVLRARKGGKTWLFSMKPIEDIDVQQVSEEEAWKQIKRIKHPLAKAALLEVAEAPGVHVYKY